MNRPYQFLFYVLLASPTFADVLTVDRVDDDPSQIACTEAPIDCTLRGAIAFAEVNPGPDEIRLPADTITLDSDGEPDLTISTQITIIGVDRDSSEITAGENFSSRAFLVEDGGSLVLEDLAITGFSLTGVGAALAVDGDPASQATLRRTRIANNRASLGGAIRLASSGGDEDMARLVIVDSDIQGNVADSAGISFVSPQCIGGALYLQDRATISNSRIFDNTTEALYGGGLCLIGGAVTISDSALTNNRTTGPNNGGAIYATSSDVTLIDSVLEDNAAMSGSGSAIVSEFGMLELQSTDVQNNSSRGFDILLTDGTVVLMEDTTLTADSLGIVDSTLTMNGVRIDGSSRGFSALNAIISADQLEVRNQTGDSGAGLYAEDSQVRLSNCLFANNRAIDGVSTSGLGGALNLEDSTLEMGGCTFSDNVADTAGGAINLSGVFLASISNSTFSNNTANSGEALQVINGGGITLTHNTYARSNGNSQIRMIGSGVTLSNNAIDGFCDLSAGSQSSSQGGNVVTNAACQLDAMADTLVTSLAVSALADFGGPTPVHLPSGTSPLLDSALDNCEPNDQRGQPRSQPCDAGAVELSTEDFDIFRNGFEPAALTGR